MGRNINLVEEREKFAKTKYNSLMTELEQKIRDKFNSIVNIQNLNLDDSESKLHQDIRNQINVKIPTLTNYDLVEIASLCDWCGKDNVWWLLYDIAQIYTDIFYNCLLKEE